MMQHRNTNLKIVTLNLNGLKRCCQSVCGGKYDGASVGQLLKHLDCDIACFQETKLDDADYKCFRRLLNAEGWDAYISFCRTNSSYSGVATFCKCSIATPRAAEEGLMRVLPPQNPAAAAADAVARATASAAAGNARYAAEVLANIAASWWGDIPFPAEEVSTCCTAEEAAALDSQGRCVITDHGLFILVNAYLPACSNTNLTNRYAQFRLKRVMCKALDIRLRAFLAAGRHVVLVGDLNSMAYPTDCAGYTAAPHIEQLHFYDGHPCWAWLRSIIIDPHHTPAAQNAAAAVQQPPPAAGASLAQQQQQQRRPLQEQLLLQQFHDLHRQLQRQQQGPASGLDLGTVAAAAAASQGYMLDVLRHFYPDGTVMYPDKRRGGAFKKRCLFTCWSTVVTQGNRVDKYGCRPDFILIADASKYRLTQQQQDCSTTTTAVRSASDLPLSTYLSSARIHRESNISDHAAVEVTLSLPPQAAALLQPRCSSSSSSSNDCCGPGCCCAAWPPVLSMKYLTGPAAAATAAKCIGDQIAHALDQICHASSSLGPEQQQQQCLSDIEHPGGNTCTGSIPRAGIRNISSNSSSSKSCSDVALIMQTLDNCCSMHVLTRNAINDLQIKSSRNISFRQATKQVKQQQQQLGPAGSSSSSTAANSMQRSCSSISGNITGGAVHGSAMQEAITRAELLYPTELPLAASVHSMPDLEQMLVNALQQLLTPTASASAAAGNAVVATVPAAVAVTATQRPSNTAAASVVASAVEAVRAVGKAAAALVLAALDEPVEPEPVTAPAAMADQLVLHDQLQELRLDEQQSSTAAVHAAVQAAVQADQRGSTAAVQADQRGGTAAVQAAVQADRRGSDAGCVALVGMKRGTQAAGVTASADTGCGGKRRAGPGAADDTSAVAAAEASVEL